MLTSARNQLSGTIRAIERGAVNDEIAIELRDGQQIAAIITLRSSQELGLAAGTNVVALVKASWIILLSPASGLRISARNQLTGKVAKVVPGAVNSEVTIELAGGDNIVAVVTNDSVSHLALTAGNPVIAAFKASSVIVGVRS